MNVIGTVCAALAIGLGAGLVGGTLVGAGPARAEPGKLPPMNDFNQAFYRCENGGAFMMSYDSDTAEKADMTTNNDNQHYELKRAPAANGVQFSNGAVRFWTDGKSTTVEGTKLPYKGCKTKAD